MSPISLHRVPPGQSKKVKTYFSSVESPCIRSDKATEHLFKQSMAENARNYSYNTRIKRISFEHPLYLAMNFKSKFVYSIYTK